jgi:hypothetical protein
VTAFQRLRFLACTTAVAFATALIAGVAQADGSGPDVPMPIPHEQAAPAPEKTLDDKVGDVLENMGDSLGRFGAATVDILILRTMGTAATAVGFGFFVVTAPMWGPFMGTTPEGFSDSWDIFVIAPVEYTYVRPLGQF